MEFGFQELKTVKIEALVVFVFEKQKTLPKDLKGVDGLLKGLVSDALKTGDVKGKSKEMTLLYTNVAVPSKRIVMVGLGPEKNCGMKEWREAVGTVVTYLQNKKITSYALLVPDVLKKKDLKELGLQTVKGMEIAAYQFTKYKTEKDAVLPEMKDCMIVGLNVSERKKFEKGMHEGKVIAETMNWVRELGNIPPHDMNPSYLASEARKIAKAYPKMSVQILEEEDMKKFGMGAVLAVGRGSTEPSKFIILEWKNGGRKNKPIVFAGKGVTFDSGGLCLKQWEKMDEMKYDMLGGAAVLGALKVVAELGLKANVVGLVPAVENLPSGTAYRPGDIIKTMSGKTIEVLNTDGEGRIILSDALCYAKKYDPEVVVDIATLTGWCAYLLGVQYAGLLGPDKQVLSKVKRASDAAGEAVWQLPLDANHTKAIKSEIADVCNASRNFRTEGVQTAAAFLKEFTDYPWAHLDIAGTAWDMKHEPWRRGGATGYGVHLLVEIVKEYI